MSNFPPPTTAPAGWYPDPQGLGPRYFDGRVWAPVVPRFVEPEEHPSLPMSVAVGALGVLMVSLVLGKLVLNALVGYEWPLISYIMISVMISYGPSVAWGVYVRRRWGARRMASLGWKFRWSDLGWGPLTWIAAVASQSVLAIVVLIFGIPLSSNIDSAGDFDADRAYLIATLLAAVIAAPIVEEVVFRGLVLRGFLSRMGPAPAILLQGVLFGVAHVDPARGVGNIGLALVLSGVGVAFGLAAYLAHRLGPTVIAHAIFNAVVFTIVLTGVLDDVDRDFGRAAVSVVVEHQIVDQPHRAEPSSDQDSSARFDSIDGVQRCRVDDLHVLERGALLCLDQ
jgi:membrane protease YdiL (CAAX protease family)